MFPLRTVTSPIPIDMSLAAHHELPSDSFELPAITATKEYAQGLVPDFIYLSREGIDPSGKVLYGEQISGIVEKIAVPDSPVDVQSWTVAQQHPKRDMESVHMLKLWCQNASSEICARL